MNLYNNIFGINDTAGILLGCLGININEIPRFRDVYLTKDHIVIHTRTGGGNRAFYDSLESCKRNYPECFEEGEESPSGPWNDGLISNPHYLKNDDDEFDCTYANFYYSFPPEYETELKVLSKRNSDKRVPSEKWKALFEIIEKRSI